MAEIWMAGGGGFDVSPVTAVSPDVIQGKVIVDKDGNSLTGTIIDRSSVTPAVSVAQGVVGTTPTIFTRIPNGAYRVPTATGSPEITLPASTVASAGGLTAAKILAGQNAFGINGTATADANLPSNRVVSGFSGYANGQKINGSIPVQGAETNGDRAWATTASNSTGIINVGVRNGHYFNGVNWIRYDMPNYRPEYIKKGVNMGGVVGTFEGWVPQSTDLYYRGNNIEGFRLSKWGSTGTVIFESGGINIRNADPYVYPNTAFNFERYNYINIEIYFETNRSNIYNWRRYGVSAKIRPDNHTSVERRTYLDGGDNRSYVISIPLSGLSFTDTYRMEVGGAGEYYSSSDDDEGWYWTNETRWDGWIYRIWVS